MRGPALSAAACCRKVAEAAARRGAVRSTRRARVTLGQICRIFFRILTPFSRPAYSSAYSCILRGRRRMQRLESAYAQAYALSEADSETHMPIYASAE